MYSEKKRHRGAALRTRRSDFRFAAYAGRTMACVLLVAGLSVPAPRATAVELESSTELATAGFYRLNWETETQSETEFELQEASTPGFADARTLYRGPDLATVLSGRADGPYYYRVRTTGAAGVGQWSEPVHVTVEHHSLARAFGFFAAGAVVFLATLGLIVFGTRQPRGGSQ
jgi:hypothetical protein